MSKYLNNWHCEAIKKNGDRCKVVRGLALCTNPNKSYGDAVFCPAHWKNPPEKVYRAKAEAGRVQR